MEEAACPSTHMYAYMHTHAHGLPLLEESLRACRHARYEMGERRACEEGRGSTRSSTCRKEVSTSHVAATAALVSSDVVGEEGEPPVPALLAQYQLLHGKYCGFSRTEGSTNFNALTCAKIKTQPHCTGDEKSYGEHSDEDHPFHLHGAAR